VKEQIERARTEFRGVTTELAQRLASSEAGQAFQLSNGAARDTFDKTQAALERAVARRDRRAGGREGATIEATAAAIRPTAVAAERNAAMAAQASKEFDSARAGSTDGRETVKRLIADSVARAATGQELGVPPSSAKPCAKRSHAPERGRGKTSHRGCVVLSY
jgi:hypothetical protein